MIHSIIHAIFSMVHKIFYEIQFYVHPALDTRISTHSLYILYEYLPEICIREREMLRTLYIKKQK